MLSIGEFSKICRVSSKTLRYYEQIQLIEPVKINPTSGYRYYLVEQLEQMLFINRLKDYDFSLKEIKTIIDSEEDLDKLLYQALIMKEEKFKREAKELELKTLQLREDIINLKDGKSIMSYLDDISIELVEVGQINLLSLRKKVHEFEVAKEYGVCFGQLMTRIQTEAITPLAPPMVLFHSQEFCSDGLDMEFSIPVNEKVKGTRIFNPGLCVKTVLKGPYTELSSIYAKQREWCEREGYEVNNALYEVYVTDPSQIKHQEDLITEIYYPVKKV